MRRGFLVAAHFARLSFHFSIFHLPINKGAGVVLLPVVTSIDVFLAVLLKPFGVHVASAIHAVMAPLGAWLHLAPATHRLVIAVNIGALSLGWKIVDCANASPAVRISFHVQGGAAHDTDRIAR